MVAANDVWVCEFLLRVVLLDQVLYDSARFPEHEIGIGVFDGGVASVGVDVDEGLLLYIIEFERVDIVWDA
jgi:hypothetical protein